MARFVLNGASLDLNAGQVEARLRGVVPEAVRDHGVRVSGVDYPVKQAFEANSGVRRADFTSQTAIRHLRAPADDRDGRRRAYLAPPIHHIYCV